MAPAGRAGIHSFSTTQVSMLIGGMHVQISRIQYFGKMAGAVGNYNAHMSAYPDVAWDEVASSFVESLGLQWNPYVTQVCTFTCSL